MTTQKCGSCMKPFNSDVSSLCLPCMSRRLYGDAPVKPAPLLTRAERRVEKQQEYELQIAETRKAEIRQREQRAAIKAEQAKKMKPVVATKARPPAPAPAPRPVKMYLPVDHRAVCALCGVRTERGQLLKHKEVAHGEQRIVTTPARDINKSLWVSVYSGGLPSLGKRSR